MMRQRSERRAGIPRMFGFTDEQKGNNSSREPVTMRDMNIPDGSRSREESPFLDFPTRRWLAVSLLLVEQFLLAVYFDREDNG